MLHYGKIDLSEGVDPVKSNNIKECMVSHYWFFNNGFQYQHCICKCCHDLLMRCLNISDIAIITVKGADYRCIIRGISKSDAINSLENSVLDDRGIYEMHSK